MQKMFLTCAHLKNVLALETRNLACTLISNVPNLATADISENPNVCRRGYSAGRSTDRAVSAYWPMDLGQSIHNSYFHAMRAQITCVFSVIIHQNIDPKSTENPATCRTARMHDFGISICCGQNHRQKKHRIYGVLSFALTPRSGGLGTFPALSH